jgi:hypothetical protein
MFRKLIILLGLLVAPAFAQELPPTIQDPTATQTYTLTVVPGTQLDNIQQTGTAANLGDDSTLTNVAIGFDFYYYGNLYDTVNISQNGFISFTSLANGCCSGMPLPNFTELNELNAPYFNYSNTHNTIFAMWSDLISFTGNPYYQSFGDKFTVGWYGVEELGSFRQDCVLDLFGLPLFCNNVGPNTFDFEITLHSNNDIAIRYGNFNNPVDTGRAITSGIQGDQSGEFWQIYYGTDTSTLENKTYVFNSSEIVPIAPIAPDCNLNPYDPTCIINDLTTPEEEIYLADDESNDGTEYVVEEEEELVADNEVVEEDVVQEEALDELLAENVDDEELVEDVMEESNAVYRELSDEEKAAILADAISKTTLESALSIAANAETSAVSQNSLTESSVISESSTRTSNVLSVSEITAETTLSSLAASSEMFVDAAREETTTSDVSAGVDALETGRVLGQAALNETLAATSESAAESVNQAESIAATSSSESLVTVTTVEATTTITDSTDQAVTETELVAEEKDNNQKDQEQTELVASETTEQSNETQNETVVADSAPVIEATQEITDTRTEETVVADIQTETTEIVTENVEVVVAEVTQSEQTSVAYQDMESAMEVFASNLPNQITVNEQEELENSIVQQAIASSQQTEDDNKMGFAEAEAVTIASDPALANAFNVQPNTASLELLGVLGSAGQDKSDAELRAEQVVAANKEEQDAINANYMEADQSGILAAIGSETDVTAYRTAMLRDNNNWYKPEDIYKGVIIKDNVRGSYFLEKGNTDTYKKMVDEQYK